MKKLIKFSILCFIILGLFMFSACGTNNYKEMEEYCYKINSIVKDIDFHTAKIAERKIILYDNENVQTQEIPFEDYANNRKITVVRKDGAAVYFTISGSVDDEQGIVFINDDSNGVLDGIKFMERIGGNSYRYSTSE